MPMKIELRKTEDLSCSYSYQQIPISSLAIQQVTLWHEFLICEKFSLNTCHFQVFGAVPLDLKGLLEKAFGKIHTKLKRGGADAL